MVHSILVIVDRLQDQANLIGRRSATETGPAAWRRSDPPWRIALRSVANYVGTYLFIIHEFTGYDDFLNQPLPGRQSATPFL